MNKVVAVDTETTGVEVWNGDDPFMIAFQWEDGDQDYFEWDVDPFTRTAFPKQKDLKFIQSILGDPNVEKVFHNAKFDIRILENSCGIKTIGPIHDTMFMAHVSNTLEPSFGLKKLAEKYLNISTQDEEDLMSQVKKCRRLAKDLGWARGGAWKQELDGTYVQKNNKNVVKTDYWMPKVMDPRSDLCLKYCLLDVERTMDLFKGYRDEVFPMLSKECNSDMWKTYDMEMELFWVVYAMETKGIEVDPKLVESMILEMRNEAYKQLAIIRKLSGNPKFNLNSPPQKADLLYNSGLHPVRHFTDTGNPSTNIDALLDMQRLDPPDPALDCILRYGVAMQSLNNYFYPQQRYPDRFNTLHTDFNQVGPNTGRFSSRKPNLQNVSDGKSLKNPISISARVPFKPRKGYGWLCPDFDQMEMVVFADAAQEPVMLAAIANGEDLHTAMCNRIWGGRDNPAAVKAALRALELEGHTTIGGDLSDELAAALKKYYVAEDSLVDPIIATANWLDEFDWDIVKAELSIGKKDSRSKTKTISFAKIYGGGPNAVTGMLNCSYEEAYDFMEDYGNRLPRIKEFSNEFMKQAGNRGWILSKFGRRLSVDPDFAYRSVNYLIQGSCADWLKRSMIKVNAYLEKMQFEARLIMCIHDELVIECPLYEIEDLISPIKRIMEDHGGAFGVPLTVGFDVVIKSWAKKIKLETYLEGIKN